MKATFTESKSGPTNKLADVVLTFDDPATKGCCLHGFSIWKSNEGEIYASPPAREYEANGEKRRFNLVRAVDNDNKDAMKALKTAIVDQYNASQS